MNPTPPLPKLPEPLLQRLQSIYEDPMYENHCEISKRTLAECIEALSQRGEAVGQVYGIDIDGDTASPLVEWAPEATDLPEGTKLFTAPQPAQPSMSTEYLIRARWPDGIEQYLHVRGMYDLGGKFGIDVDAPECHPLAQPPTAEAAPVVVQPANQCPLTECQGKPRCEHCKAMDAKAAQPANPVPMTDGQRGIRFRDCRDRLKLAIDYQSFSLGVESAESFHHIKEAQS